MYHPIESVSIYRPVIKVDNLQCKFIESVTRETVDVTEMEYHDKYLLFSECLLVDLFWTCVIGDSPASVEEIQLIADELEVMERENICNDLPDVMPDEHNPDGYSLPLQRDGICRRPWLWCNYPREIVELFEGVACRPSVPAYSSEYFNINLHDYGIVFMHVRAREQEKLRLERQAKLERINELKRKNGGLIFRMKG